MKTRILLSIHRLSILLALAVSSALLADYMRPMPAFCGIGSACDHLRRSPLGRLSLIPIPAIGAVAFAVLLVTSLLQNWQRLHRALSVFGGLCAVGLIVTQAKVLGQFCKLCVTVDIAAIVAAATILLVPRRSDPTHHGRSNEGIWTAAGFLSLVLPLGFGLLAPASPRPPSEITSLWAPAKINVVEFADFECPFCRALHPRLTQALAAYGDRVHLVRLNMPLPSHENAEDAARAYCCADAQGKGDAMADELFASEDLSPEGCRTLAEQLSLDTSRYDACLASEETNRRLQREAERVNGAGFRGLPTLWIGEQMLVGLQPPERLQQALADAAAGKKSLHIHPAFLWLLLGVVFAACAIVSLRGGEQQTASSG